MNTLKEMNGRYYGNANVVMLATQSKAVREGQLVIGAGNYLFASRKADNIGSLTAYELYITSDEEIKESDYGLSTLNKIVLIGKLYDKSLYKKIIATTDKSLGLPQPSTQFIKAYIEAYIICKKAYTTYTLKMRIMKFFHNLKYLK